MLSPHPQHTHKTGEPQGRGCALYLLSMGLSSPRAETGSRERLSLHLQTNTCPLGVVCLRLLEGRRTGAGAAWEAVPRILYKCKSCAFTNAFPCPLTLLSPLPIQAPRLHPDPFPVRRTQPQPQGLLVANPTQPHGLT
jgi:hypothetical protein